METKWGPVGELVFLRTYSRFIPEEGRRESWPEVVDRVVEYSTTLGDTYPGEKEALRKLMLSLKGLPAGRTLWIGGTEYARGRNGHANYNCAYTNANDLRSFYDMTYLLMAGVGVGFGVQHHNIHALNRAYALPPNPPKVEVLPYSWLGYGHAQYRTHTTVTTYGDIARLVVGDSREGWADAVYLFLNLLVDGTKHIVIDVNSVRPEGERVRLFGGYASGPALLVEFFTTVPNILWRLPTGWTATKVLDIMNLIGRMIVVGGTRRSAQIALGPADDHDFITAKTGEWWRHYPWRSQSNNTIVFDSKPSKADLEQIFQSIMQYGEPGFLNSQEASRRRPDFSGVNPCAEILLADHGFCNLATVVLPRHVSNGQIDKHSLEQTLRLLTRHAIRITNVPLPDVLWEWAKTQYRDRLIGISFTGYGDLVDGLELSPNQQAELLEWMRQVVHQEASAYASALGIPEPLLKTTVKPEGTLSLLAGVSSGIHAPYAPYYIRRIRINKHDAVAKALHLMGFEPKPEVGYESLDDSIVWVYEFPVATPAKRSANDIPAIEQLERYRLAMRHYADHNVSITVTLANEEVPQVIDWLDKHWNDYVAVSFLPKDPTVYPLAPFEPITREAYQQMVRSTPSMGNLYAYVQAVDSSEAMTDPTDGDCATGACPVR